LAASRQLIFTPKESFSFTFNFKIKETKFYFTKRTIDKFETWTANFKLACTVLFLQQHHTWGPDYNLFTGNNHFEMQKAMRDYHINHNGWM